MNWNVLNSEAQLEALREESKQQPVLIFKHSTRCSISATAKARLERKWADGDNAAVKPYYLDLLNYRGISNRIAEEFGVRHESPQVLVLKDGKAAYHASHMDIRYEDILAGR